MISLSHLTPKSLRYERKYLLPGLPTYTVESIIKTHPSFFREVFHVREVNNIYFDTLSMNSYHDHLSGTSQRAKVRIRWYSDLFGTIQQPMLEVKIKNGDLGSKLLYPLDSFEIDNDFSMESMRSIIKQSLIPPFLNEDISAMKPMLMNRYTRKYFLSVDKKIRLTLDWDMEFFHVDSVGFPFKRRIRDSHITVLEIKNDPKHSDEVQMTTKYFPFRLSKISKYIRGIDLLYS